MPDLEENAPEVVIKIILEGEEGRTDLDLRQLAIAVDRLLMRQITERPTR